MRNLSKQQSNRAPSERSKNPTNTFVYKFNPLVASVNRFFQGKLENEELTKMMTKKTVSSQRQPSAQNKKKTKKVIRVNIMKQQMSQETNEENRDIEEIMDNE